MAGSEFKHTDKVQQITNQIGKTNLAQGVTTIQEIKSGASPSSAQESSTTHESYGVRNTKLLQSETIRIKGDGVKLEKTKIIQNPIIKQHVKIVENTSLRAQTSLRENLLLKTRKDASAEQDKQDQNIKPTPVLLKDYDIKPVYSKRSAQLEYIRPLIKTKNKSLTYQRRALSEDHEPFGMSSSKHNTQDITNPLKTLQPETSRVRNDVSHRKCSERNVVTAERHPRKCVLTLDGYSYVIVANPPERRVQDDSSLSSQTPSLTSTPRNRNGQSNENSASGPLTIVRRTSTRRERSSESETLDDVTSLSTEALPAVDTPEACDKAALRLRHLQRLLRDGQVPVELLQDNLQYAARVLEAVYLDESSSEVRSGVEREGPQAEPPPAMPPVRRTLRTPVWAKPRPTARPTRRAYEMMSINHESRISRAMNIGRYRLVMSSLRFRRLADDDDELSEVQPDAVPAEVREWLASTFTRQLATTRRTNDENKPKFRTVAHAIRAGIFVDRIYRRVTTLPTMKFPPDVIEVLKTLDDWSFDVFALNDAANGHPIRYLGYDILNRYGILHKFKVSATTLEAFLSRVEEGYKKYNNPYHNNLHGADVAQTVHHVLCQTGLMNWLTDLEIFATLIAAIIHDYEHTGTTNSFHVMSGSETALLYNDRAVLENHHISATFKLLRDEEYNILAQLTREEFREFRTLVIDIVLATDMSHHFQQLKNMRNALSLLASDSTAVIDKSKALGLVVHLCDISHPSKQWNIHFRWTELLLEEFFRQGDLEHSLGLPYSPLCDRNNTLVAESQIGFIEFIVEPSMNLCMDMLDNILRPLHKPCTPHLSKQEEISSCKKSTDDSEFEIKKPWAPCLIENKKNWKERAAKEAEVRAEQERKLQELEQTLNSIEMDKTKTTE